MTLLFPTNNPHPNTTSPSLLRDVAHCSCPFAGPVTSHLSRQRPRSVALLGTLHRMFARLGMRVPRLGGRVAFV